MAAFGSNRRRTAVLGAARLLQEQRAADGYVGALSPTPHAFIAELLADTDVFASTSRSSSVLDLGCGDGRWLTAFATRFPGSVCVGVEMDAAQLARCPSRGTVPGVDLVLADFTKGLPCRCSAFDVIVVYLSRHGNEVLKATLAAECVVGTKVLAVGFEMKGWVATKTFRCRTTHLGAYLYVIT